MRNFVISIKFGDQVNLAFLFPQIAHRKLHLVSLNIICHLICIYIFMIFLFFSPYMLKTLVSLSGFFVPFIQNMKFLCIYFTLDTETPLKMVIRICLTKTKIEGRRV